MTFGKHRGQLVSDVPTPYLQWVVRECYAIEAWLKAAVKQELRRRGAEVDEAQPSSYPPPADLRTAVKAWFAQLSLKYHPDRGGSDAQMRAINEAHEKLRELLRIG